MLTAEQQIKHEQIVAKRNALFNKENHTIKRNEKLDEDEDYEAYDMYIKNVPKKKECRYYE